MWIDDSFSRWHMTPTPYRCAIIVALGIPTLLLLTSNPKYLAAQPPSITGQPSGPGQPRIGPPPGIPAGFFGRPQGIRGGTDDMPGGIFGRTGGISGIGGGISGVPGGFPGGSPQIPGFETTETEWRCTGCKALLGKGTFPPSTSFCPGCGALLVSVDWTSPGPNVSTPRQPATTLPPPTPPFTPLSTPPSNSSDSGDGPFEKLFQTRWGIKIVILVGFLLALGIAFAIRRGKQNAPRSSSHPTNGDRENES